jgi:hypothetical protein
MKTCTQCEEVKPPEEFYAGDCKCKVCRNREKYSQHIRRMRDPEWREKVLAQKRAANQRRRQRGLCLTPEQKARKSQTGREWGKRNRLKRRAHRAVQTAVRNGTLVKQPCEVCGVLPSEGHHDDYTRPLDVRWLCTAHHAARHVEMRRLERLANDRREGLSASTTDDLTEDKP